MRDPRAAELAIAECRARLGAPDAMATWWEGLTPGARRFLLAVASLPRTLAGVAWEEIRPADRVAIMGALKRAAGWARLADWAPALGAPVP
jgi:hypothetical protein